MLPWQDDNALFFKLAHLAGPAGFLGPGIFGVGPYKYTAFFYTPIYFLFKYNIPFYFIYTFIMYFLATVVLYETTRRMFGEKVGKVASFLFATGYIASDGIIRLYNSFATSLSIILISLMLFSYWKFYKKSNYKFYFFSIFCYFLSVELIYYRNHYLIIIPLVFEIIFLLKKKISSLFTFSARMAPFVFIFYKYFIQMSDSRTVEIKNFISGLLRGEFFRLYSFLSSVSNLTISDWFTGFLSRYIHSFAGGVFLIFLVSIIVFFLVLRNKKRGKTYFLILSSCILIWVVVSRSFFSAPVLNLSSFGKIIPFLGGAILLLVPIIFFLIKREEKKIFLLMSIWSLANLASYSVYDQTALYSSDNRYLAHSFFAIVIIFALLASKRKIVLGLVIAWGIGNLIFGFANENNILYQRSFPVKRFYEQLETYLPKINKGDVLYFDVADNVQNYFASAFSVAQMPEETAIAWRYGVDRYDFKRITNFDDLESDITNNNLRRDQIYSFFYSKDGLIDTTNEFRKTFKTQNFYVALGFTQKNEEVVFDSPVDSVVPFHLKLDMLAKPRPVFEINFPYLSNTFMQTNGVAGNPDLRQLAFDYKNFKEDFQKTSEVWTTSDWRENIHQNLLDGNENTLWQPDRILWNNGKEYAQLDLGKIKVIDRFVWVNAYANNSPTKYWLEVSKDGNNWSKIKEIKNLGRIESGTIGVIKFPSQSIRYLRFHLEKTLNEDSPGISEIWVVPTKFDSLDINETEKFLDNPFGYVPDERSYESTLDNLKGIGKIKVYWMSDKSGGWLTDDRSIFEVNYNNIKGQYEVFILGGGTKITKLKFVQLEIPGSLSFTNISLKQ